MGGWGGEGELFCRRPVCCLCREGRGGHQIAAIAVMIKCALIPGITATSSAAPGTKLPLIGKPELETFALPA